MWRELVFSNFNFFNSEKMLSQYELDRLDNIARNKGVDEKDQDRPFFSSASRGRL